MATIDVNTWGKKGAARELAETLVVRVPMPGGLQDRWSAVQRSIERRTGLKVCGCTPQGTRMERGRAVGDHFELTLGKRLPRRLGGGHSVQGSLWIEVPCG